MSAIFISYRRADAQGWAARLGADIATAFGDVACFFDLASIPPGGDFRREIERALSGAAAALVLIGPRWIDSRKNDGERRLDDPEDLVAAEVEQALALAAPVIPLLLGGAPMPSSDALPERLRGLSRRNALELSDARWEFDRDRLFAALEAATPLRRRPAVPVAGVSVGAGLELRDAEVGRITGVRGTVSAGSVDVLKGARLTNVKLADISGVDLVPSREPKA